jgi:ribonuclease T2
MNNGPLALLAVLLAAAPLPAAAWNDGGTAVPSAVAGQFDTYLFMMSWEPTFCEGKQSAMECADQRPDRFDATNFALHGLWPDKNGDTSHSYGYCGGADRSLDRDSTWCQLPEPQLSAATRAALTTVMPGVASCLDHHEWAVHGSCSGLSGDDYFTAAAALVQQVAGSAFGRFLTAHAGQTVDASAALAAFATDFGPGSGDKIVFNCADVNGVPALLDASMRLPNPLRPASELAGMLLPVGKSSNCPSSFLLTPVPSR